MYARVTTFKGLPEQIEGGIETFREQALPWMRDATGFRGWIAFLDRDAGESIGITFWTDEDALRDDIASGAGLRDEIARQVEASMQSTGAYEVLAIESLDLDED